MARRRSQATKEGSPSRSTSRPSKRAVGKSVFVPRNSLLDADSGPLDLVGYTDDQYRRLEDRSAFAKNIRGWLNLFWIVMAYYVLMNWYQHYRANGTIYWPQSWVLLKMTYRDWTFFGLAELLLHAYTCLALPFQKAIFRGYLPASGPLYLLIRHAYQAMYIIGPLKISWARRWPPLQVGTFFGHCLVHYMKAHAFLSTNQQLHLSKRWGRRADEYPMNLTLNNMIYFLLAPTLLYETAYPRTSKIRWTFVLDRTAGIVAILTILYAVVDAFVVPILSAPTSGAHWHDFFDRVAHLILPTLSVMLLLFFLVFEYMLNWFAELTRFADRFFYDDWWNSVAFDEFARKWNVPVHRFLQRHVYLSCIENHKMSKGWAAFMTFLWSSILHELIMSSMILARRGPKATMFVLQMLQVPLIWIANKVGTARFQKLSNIFFWMSIILGVSLLIVHYSR